MRDNRRRKKRVPNKLLKRNQIKYIVLAIACLFIILLITTGFAVINSFNTGIISNTYINGINVSKKEVKEVYQELNNILNERKIKNIQLKYLEYETSISLSQLNVTYDIQGAITKAYKIGREKNIFKSNFQVIKTLLFRNEIKEDIQIDIEELDRIIDDIETKLPGKVQESSYYIDGDNLIIINGISGIKLNKEQLKNKIIETINKQIDGQEIPILELEVQEANPVPIDIDKIYEEIYKEKKDAYYEEETNKFYPHINGVDFAISKEKVNELIQEEKEEYIIPLKITVPNITIEKLAVDIFPDELGKYSTRYNMINQNRNNNIQLAANKINGTILMPGETFSFNKIVGERNIKAGYKEAAVYVNGKIVNGIGGGICQVSSTLYNAVLYSNLEVTSRRNHYFITSYVNASRDATVSYGTIDFKFKNNRKYPIKIQCIAKNGILETTICGIKEENEYEIIIEDKVTEIIPYNTKYVYNKELQEGEEIIIQSGIEGYKSEAYKVLKQNGQVISKTLISKDSYNSLQQIIETGTKQ